MVRRAWALMLWLLIGGSAVPAWADDAAVAGGASLQQLDVVPLGSGSRVSVRFACPLRYTSHFPSKDVAELRVSLAPLPGCTPGALPEGLLRAPVGNPAGLVDARLEPAGSALVLTLTFSRVVDLSVRPWPDFLGLDVAVIGGGAATTTRAGTLKTPRPGQLAPPASPNPAPLRPLPPAQVLESQWKAAKSSFDQGDYMMATRQLARLLEYPEHAYRAEAQELLGLAREREGQLAHAKAEYEEYLRRYPDGPATARVSQRLAALTTLDSRQPVEAVAKAQDDGMRWTSYGGWSQDYRRDSTSIEADQFSTDFLSQSMIITDADFSLRGRGQRFDVQFRINGGYMVDLLPDGPGDQTRMSLAYAELADRKLGLVGRLGRQSKHSGGVLGTFDGLSASWQLRSTLRLNAMAGFPVQSTRESFSSDRQFLSLSMDWSGWLEGLEISPFLISQSYDGLGDRQAVGGQVRWYVPGKTLVGMVDYDVDYGALNLAYLLGTFQLPGRWTVTGSLDHRKSPFLTTRNALAGQPVRSIGELVDQWGESGVRALAEDRTAEVDTISLGVSRPLGERFQWSVDMTGTRMSAMPASGGVPAIPGTGFDFGLGAQLIGTSLFRAGDMTILGLRRYDGSSSTTTSMSVSSRFPLLAGFRIAPRLRFDQREFKSDGSTQWMASPSFRLDWNWKRATVELEAGGEFVNRERPTDREKTNRYWMSLGYRVSF